MHHFPLEILGPGTRPWQALKVYNAESDNKNLSTYILTRGLVTACNESRAAVKRRSRRHVRPTAIPGNDETENTLRIVTSKLGDRVEELFYCDSSHLVFLRLDWGGTEHDLFSRLAELEFNTELFGAPHLSPKHIGLEIDHRDTMWLKTAGLSACSPQYLYWGRIVTFLKLWVTHGATLYFGHREDDASQTSGSVAWRRVEGSIFYDSRYRYLPVNHQTCRETFAVGEFMTVLANVWNKISGKNSSWETSSSLKD